ncbi:MAG: deoxyribodipyrimidine photo-lyase, partial [Cyanobium sp.]
MEPLQVVWFKRDLRAADHRPLWQAGQRGPVLPLFVVEPPLWQQPDAAARQWAFCAESLEALRKELAGLGMPLVVRIGAVEQVLERARRQFGIGGLWSHEETGNGLTYARDRRIVRWALAHGIPWTEIPQFGVIRRLASRDGWARRWEARMAEPLTPPPRALQPLEGIDPGPIPSSADLGLAPDPCPQRQRGGRQEGLALLHSFLVERGRNYHRDLSSPLSAERGCSRLSAHLAWGTLSLREVIQASRARGADLRALPPAERASWPRALRGFEERLHWHCHFIQKLEDQPDLEFRSLHPLCAAGGPANGLEEGPYNGNGDWNSHGYGNSDGNGNRNRNRNGNDPETFAADRLGESLCTDRRAEGASIAGERLASERPAAERLAAWAEGRTGIPFVDACMRSLIASGW